MPWSISFGLLWYKERQMSEKWNNIHHHICHWRYLGVDCQKIISFLLINVLYESYRIERKQVTRGHNIVADGWAGASNPHFDPTHPPTAHKHQKRSLSYFSTRAHGRMDQWMDQQMDKASYRVCPQLKTVSRLLILIVLDKVSVDIRNHRAFLNHQSLTSKND